MNKRVFIIEGLAFLLIGLVFLLNSFSSITGAVVLENVGVDISGLLGLAFVVVGLVMMMSGKKKALSIDDVVDSEGVKPTITPDFRDAIRRHPAKRVISTIRKIKSGLAGEEFLKYRKHWAIRSGESGYRIIYDRNADGGVTLLTYSEHYKDLDRE